MEGNKGKPIKWSLFILYYGGEISNISTCRNLNVGKNSYCVHLQLLLNLKNSFIVLLTSIEC